MMKDKINLKYLLWMQGGALLFSISNIFSKFAAREDIFSVKFILLYGCSLGIMFIYALLWQQILKHVSMITAYSNRLIAMIWGIVWGALIFGEKISLTMLVGTVIIIIGLYITVKAEE